MGSERSTQTWGLLQAQVPAPHRKGDRGRPVHVLADRSADTTFAPAKGIGPDTPWCVTRWTPERDPAGTGGKAVQVAPNRTDASATHEPFARPREGLRHITVGGRSV